VPASPAATSSLGSFGEGLAAPWHGWVLLYRNPRLWGCALVPTLVNVLISLVVCGLLIGGIVGIADFLHGWMAGQTTGWGWYFALAAEIAIVLVLSLVLIVLALIAWKILTVIFCGYFFSRLAEEVERLLGVGSGELRPVGAAAEAAGLLLSLTMLIVGSTLILALAFIPVVGGVLAFIVGTIFTCWIMGLDYLGFPLSLRGIPRWRQYPVGLAQFSRTCGLGLFVSVCEFIPIFGALPLTTAVIGSVLMHRKLHTNPTR
jgi:CysZ protein